MKKKLTADIIPDVDYQIKTKELVKEALFLRQYGVNPQTKQEIIPQKELTENERNEI